MSIEDLQQKIKGLGGKVKESHFSRPFSVFRLPELSQDVFLGTVVLLVAFGAFGLGRLSKIEGAKVPIRIENSPEVTPKTFSSAKKEQSNKTPILSATDGSKDFGRLVGSKTGNKYHYPWCSGASRIAEQNRIYFASKSEAERAGYTPAANCKGL